MTLQVLLPMAGKNMVLQDNKQPYPVSLIEVGGRPIIQRVVENVSLISGKKEFFFFISDEEKSKFHLDRSLKLLAKDAARVIVLKEAGFGSVCTCLWAIDDVDENSELLILNSDQIFKNSMDSFLEYFRTNGADAGLVTFNSIHPRWSYARYSSDLRVTECAEKNPISNNAIAGFYYFKRAKDFFDASKSMIMKRATVNGSYFVAPTMNELILRGKNVLAYEIDSDDYYSFYSAEKIRHYNQRLV